MHSFRSVLVSTNLSCYMLPYVHRLVSNFVCLPLSVVHEFIRPFQQLTFQTSQWLEMRLVKEEFVVWNTHIL